MARAPDKPRARSKGLLVRELADETLVYDLERSRAYCLSPVAARVWRHCDGTRSAADLARLVEAGAEDGEAVWLVLERLSHSRLLETRVRRPPSSRRCSRRELLRRMGAGGAALVASIVVPTAAHAQAATDCPYAACIGGTATPGCCCQPGGPPGTGFRECRRTGATFNCNGPAC